MEEAIVLYPSPQIGHLVSMVELGRLILKHQPSCSVIIFIANVPFSTGSTAAYLSHVSTTTSSIVFHHLPDVPFSPNCSSASLEELAFEIPRLHNANVLQALKNIGLKSRIKAVVLDFFCNAAFEVSSSDLGLPTYFFFTLGVSDLALPLHFPTLDKMLPDNLKDHKAALEIPGIPPIYTSDLPETTRHRTDKVYRATMELAVQMTEASGIIVNTFEALEPRAMKAITDGLCTPNAPTPTLYCVGPLVANSNIHGYNGSVCYDELCLTWLDLQPSGSVVFLCFGSQGSFKDEQLKEMAVALENSGHRFLWVVRNRASEGEMELNAILPEGFLERTAERGLVVKSWAPQGAILNHDSVGGFVTHCGWNSLLEALLAGVPMVAWPLYAEQRLNKAFMVEEMRVALPLAETEEDRFVYAAELEKRVRELMESESKGGGMVIRERVMAFRDAAKAAVKENGSSHIALAKLLQSWN
ncbi:PREDICTED: UDP-glycosyltransferase 88B1 [Ipomoea nil]|uniref:UDP-glycosyltransferase 88B1 n=1 Tax=Ipomoea nil TaxID=35883 RepID=UPI000900F5B8|nr:PREDICTED: UDP-glycosyltransferase 88B1 [Ipomoea nil]XP_019200221.1 PREDICTED: UDP-glycosyltransferase 88B1 [Ipomoea nil]XP_019200222.1 PREDICTED: UDP-glycosyltransferase 88B1 [Ipomoea nil]XP_019200223.1 PREDICTED: UDP-glycosyltransferase 88B1 [Ipomoea nil]